jgi:fucose permease
MHPDPASNQPASTSGTLQAAGARKALAGFLISGLLFAFTGAILPAWEHHLTSEYLTVTGYFLSAIAGVLLSAFLSPVLVRRFGSGRTLAAGCSLAAAALLGLAAATPPAPSLWRMAGLAALCLGADILHTAIFHAITPIYKHDPAATVNLAGILFGTGCLIVAVLIAGTFYIYTVPSILILLAVIPAMFAIHFARGRFEQRPIPRYLSIKQLIGEIRSPGSVLLSMLVFFQFGNEWSIAGWLPLYLIQRLGMSPASALWMLALYFVSLTLGRVIVQSLLPRFSHSRLMWASVTSAIFGCTILISTSSRVGAGVAVVTVGLGFAAIYPLLVERIGYRFPNYHPGFYNDSVSLALMAGLLAPALLGAIAWQWGLKYTMLIPLLGSIAVFVIVGLIWVEARLSAGAERQGIKPTPE